MFALAALPFAFALVLRMLAPRLAARLPPQAATWLLTGLALTAALTCGLILSGAAVISIAQLPQAAHVGQWSAAVLRDADSPPPALGFAAALVVALLIVAALYRCGLSVRALLRARRVLTTLPAVAAQLSVVPGDVPTAYAVGGRSGRIVVSTAMLSALGAGERRALLAHEHAHLRHRHFVFVQLTELAAAANPLLLPVVAAVRRSIERWADEDAAVLVGDRRLAARSLARAAVLHSSRPPAHSGPNLAQPLIGFAAMVDGEVPTRVRALLAPPPRPQWRIRVTLILGALGCWVAGAVVTIRLHGLIEIAEHLYNR
jgi:Zn-dependent protease with chaperone function